MKYADYYDCDICNGNSVGMSLFVSGCPIHCKDCFNSEIWDFNSGIEWTPKIEEIFLKKAEREYIKRITFVGGSPLCEENVLDVDILIQKLRKRVQEKQIWVYTGYTWETLTKANNTDVYKARMNILNNIDVLVDGTFDCTKRDLSLAFRGSSNQRIIDVKNTLALNRIVLWDKEV